MGSCQTKLKLPDGYVIDITSNESMNDLQFKLENRNLYKKDDRKKLDRLASKAIGALKPTQ